MFVCIAAAATAAASTPLGAMRATKHPSSISSISVRQRAVGPPLSAYSGWETPPLNKLSWVVTPTLYLLHAVVSALCCSVPRVLAASLLALL